MVPARFLLSVATLIATGLQGQEPPAAALTEPTISGVVRDVDGRPVADVEVGVVRGEQVQQFATSAPDGRFLLTGVARGVVPLRIRRLGYAMQFHDVDSRVPSARNIEIVLRAVPNELEEVMIAAREGGKLHEFYERKQQRGSFARFLVQREIRQLGPTYASDLFRSIPGIVIRTATGGNTIRIRGCQPMVWLDGQRVPGAELDEVIHPSEIAAIEFYPSNAGIPAQYLERQNRLCGLVLVWTRTQ